MPLMEHIRELRSRVLKALLALGLGTVVGWFFFNPVWRFLERPYCKIQIHDRPPGAVLGSGHCTLFVTGIFDAFFLHLKVAVVVGILISSPVWLYQLWAFIAPGLYARERRWTYAFVGTAVPLFALGGAFAYLAMSRGLHFLLGLVPNGAQPIITIDTYLGYAMAMLLIFGLAFELPLTLVILNLAGVLTHERFRKWRRDDDLRRVRVRRRRHAEPGSVHDAAARRALCVACRGSRGRHLGERPAPGAQTLAL